MRFFQIIASGAALVASVIAQSSTVAINSYPSSGVEAGKSYTITYTSNDDAATTFLLRKGASTDLSTIATLTTTATGGSYTWTVDSTLVNGDDYALEIKQGDEVNYSAQFPLTGGSASVSSAISSAASSAASSASSVASSVGYAASSVASSKASSVSSRVSSAVSSMITSQSSMVGSVVSGVITSSAHNNGTVSSATLSRSSTSAKSTSSVTSSASVPESTGAASMLTSSPLALIFGAAAAMMYLN